MYYWLVIDHSGTGDYAQGQTEYIKLGLIISLPSIKIEKHNLSGSIENAEIISIKTAPEMLVQAWITQPVCSKATKGKLDLKTEGGSAPFQITLTRISDNIVQNTWVNHPAETETFLDLDPGEYTYSVQDSQAREYKETLNIESSDAPQNNLKSEYSLVEGKSLSLDSAVQEGIEYNYRWTNEQGETESFFFKINIKRAGVYKIKITNVKGCYSIKTIKITNQSADNFKKVDLFSNPSIGGEYYLRINLIRKAPVYIKTYDSLGRLMGQDKITGSGLLYVPRKSSFTRSLLLTNTIRKFKNNRKVVSKITHI